MQNNKPLALRQPTESELKEILDFYTDGYAPYGFIEDLQGIFQTALNGMRNDGEQVSLYTVNGFHALQCIEKMLHAFNPYRAD